MKIAHENGAVINANYRLATMGREDLAVGQTMTKERFVGCQMSMMLQNKPDVDDPHQGSISSIKWGTEVTELLILPYMGEERPPTPKGYEGLDEVEDGGGGNGDGDKRRALGDSQGSHVIPGRRGETVCTFYPESAANGAPYTWGVSDDHGKLEVADVALFPVDSSFDAEVTRVRDGFAVTATSAFRAEVRVRAMGKPGKSHFHVWRRGGMPEYYPRRRAAALMPVQVGKQAFVMAGHEGWQGPEDVTPARSEFAVSVQEQGEVTLHFDFGGPCAGIPFRLDAISESFAAVIVEPSEGDTSIAVRVVGLAPAVEGGILRFSALGREVVVRVQVTPLLPSDDPPAEEPPFEEPPVEEPTEAAN